ncbi:MAG: ATP-binding protein [Planctomycetota bacterium]
MPLKRLEQSNELLARAIGLYREGAFTGAIELLDGLLVAGPDKHVSYLKGIILKDMGQAHEAVACFDRAILADDSLERLHYHRGTARFDADNREGALEDLREAITREPLFLFAVYNLGVVAVALRRWDEAKTAFARCLDLDPANRAEYVDLLVEIGHSAAEEEVYSQVHRIKNRIGIVGDQSRLLVQQLQAEESQAAAALGPISKIGKPGKREQQGETSCATAERLQDDLRRVYEDIARFLRAVKQEPPEVDLVDIAEVCERCLFALSPRLRGVIVERHFDEWLPEVIGDRRSLGEAIMNVLTNSVEAVAASTEAGTAEKAERKPAHIRIALRAVDRVPEIPGVDTIMIEVEDSGQGIDAEVLPKLFNLGYTTKRYGSGMGLTYTARVARAHGGRVEIRSDGPGRGTQVRLVLPASPVGAPNLRTLSLRSALVEDLAALDGPSAPAT